MNFKKICPKKSILGSPQKYKNLLYCYQAETVWQIFLFDKMPKGANMFTKLFGFNEENRQHSPREGDLFKVIELHGARFEIRYGYYEEIERHHEPMEIYPDFIKNPVYTIDGFPFVTLMQDACKNYEACAKGIEHDCSSCIYMERGDELIAVCRCEKNKRRA